MKIHRRAAVVAIGEARSRFGYATVQPHETPHRDLKINTQRTLSGLGLLLQEYSLAFALRHGGLRIKYHTRRFQV